MALINRQGGSDPTQTSEERDLQGAQASVADTYRHLFVVHRLERLVEAMQHPDTGVPFKAQKAFLSTVPAAVSGNDLIAWVRDRAEAPEPGEAVHIAEMLAVYGYVYPLAEGHSLQVRDESGSLYRFQSPYYWLSISGRPDNVDYAIYLTKRMIRSKHKAGFEDYEKSALARLQKLLADRWQFIALQAEEELKLSRERKKNDRMVLDMQEQAYWRVHRPPPGYMNPVDHPLARAFTADQMLRRMAKGREKQQQQHDRHMQCRREKQQEMQEAAAAAAAAAGASVGHKSVDTIVMSYELTKSFDWFLQVSAPVGGLPHAALGHASAASDAGSEDPSPAVHVGGSPWLLDDPGMFQLSQGTGESGLTPKQVKLWGTSFDFLLRDAAGREYFKHFLTKEFSSENLRFWLAVQDYKFGSGSLLNARMESIHAEFLAPGAPSEINIDSRTMNVTQRGIQNPGRFTFEEAQEHIYLLMKKDSYQRFLRSEDYRSLLQTSADRHAFRKATAVHALSFTKRPAQPPQAAGGRQHRPDAATTTSSAETSGSGSNRHVRRNPVAVVQLQQQQQQQQQRQHQHGMATSGGSNPDDVAPWEVENHVTPWETSARQEILVAENPVAPWETSGNPGNPGPSGTQGNLENPVTPWETSGNPGPSHAQGNPENPVTPWETSGIPVNPGPSRAQVNPENSVTPWETEEKPENHVTPWE